jgi:hypothetical protein
LERALAFDDRAMSDEHAFDIGDGVIHAGCAFQRDTQVAGADELGSR